MHFKAFSGPVAELQVFEQLNSVFGTVLLGRTPGWTLVPIENIFGLIFQF